MKKVLLLSIMLSFIAAAQQSQSVSKLLRQSLKRFNISQYVDTKELGSVSPWLTGLPSVQLSLLQSENKLGADEYEINLNLPFKSRARKKLDEQLLTNNRVLMNLNLKSRSLLVSGLIREMIWAYKIAVKKKQIEQAKLNWLKKQKTLLVKQVNSGGSQLDLLFVENQLYEAQLLILEFERDVKMRLNQFRKMTGINHIPETFYENIIKDDEHDIILKHPSVQQLQLAIEQASINYNLSGKANSPINISLTALDIKAPGGNDRQYGIGIEVPIGLNKSKTQSDRISWLQNQNVLSAQLVAFERNFSNQLTKLVSEHQFLTQKQIILKQQSIKTKEIFSTLEQLRNSNELNHSLYFQRMIELIASMHQGELNTLYINQNQSRQNQLAGVSL